VVREEKKEEKKAQKKIGMTRKQGKKKWKISIQRHLTMT
jgi:hypothetical protein